LGFSVVLYAVTTLFAACTAIEQALAHLSDAGRAEVLGDRMNYAKFSDIVDLARFQAFAHDHEA
jgi:2-methylisocitrate lyase-like PEP mutase family enzyme